MTGKTALLIASGVIVAGAVGYGVYKYLQNKEDPTMESDSTSNNEDFEWFPKKEDPIYEVQAEFEQATVTSESTQQNAATIIRENHQEAAQEMRRILDDIQEDSAQFDETHKLLDEKLEELLK